MDWSTLPGDLLRLVSGRLHDPLDFLRFRAVCRSWRSAAAASSPPRFLPWLLARPAHPTAALSFFSLSAGATRSVAAPSAAHRILGPTRSHLLLSDTTHDHLLLLNPLTGARLPLPDSPFPASSPVIQGYRVSGTDSSAPVVLYNAKKLFFHFRHPDPASGEPTNSVGSWTEVPMPGLVAENMYHDGKVFVCDEHGHITVFDAATLAVVGAVPPPPVVKVALCRDAFKCIAFVPSGDELLCVIRYFGRDGQGELLEDCGGLEVYRLEMEIGRGEGESPSPPRWVQMRSIGDRMLFVGLYQGFSFRAVDFAGFKGDCIYFFKLEMAKRSCIYRFSMEDGRTEELPGPWMHACTWFVPSLS
ncbi:putative F-box protein At1g65770 [Phragmites australis]|uniref:putative F-box protein At1g65770 n=1 Tax=Phragmites australis TaxID=29695 RepID=UPI002D78AC93|nr:putative F-box protein At1g65770 [Phragmites australis]